MSRLHDKSTEAIKRKLKTPRDPRVVEAHAGVASVNTDGGAKPRQPDSVGPNAAANAAFNEATKGPNERPNVVMVGGK
jgi:hypothetical protein